MAGRFFTTEPPEKPLFNLITSDLLKLERQQTKFRGHIIQPVTVSFGLRREANPMMWIHLAGVYGACTRLNTRFRGPGNFWSQLYEFTSGGGGQALVHHTSKCSVTNGSGCFEA